MKNNLYQYILSHEKHKHIFVRAQGGSGKTTQLRFIESKLIERAKSGEKIVPIYVDIKLLNEGSKLPIYKYIMDFCKFLPNIEIDSFFQSQYTKNGYTFYFLIDGLNEAPYQLQENINNNIKLLKKAEGVNIIITSRSEHDNEVFNSFEHILLKDLDNDVITGYLSKHFKQTVEGERFNQSLIEILRVPLYLKTFVETYVGKKSFPDLYNSKIVRRADLLNAYLDKLITDTNSDNSILTNTENTKFMVEYYLPAFAFQMALNNKLSFTDDEYEKYEMVLTKDYFNRFFSKLDIQKGKSMPNNITPLVDMVEKFALFSEQITENKYTYTLHETWRDLLAAKYIVVTIEKSKRFDELEEIVNQNIQRFVGELVKAKDNLCECDFEGKTDIKDDDNPNSVNAKQSPIEVFMQKNHKLLNQHPLAIRNLIEIMKISRNNRITGNYRNLNLEYSDFKDCNLKNSDISNSIVSEETFYTSVNHQNRFCFKIIDFSDDYLFLYYNQNIICYSLNNYSIIYVINETNIKNCIVDFDNNRIVICKERCFAVYDIRIGIKLYDMDFSGITERIDDDYQFFYEVDSKVFVGVENKRKKVVVLDPNFKLMFFKDFNNPNYVLKFFNGKGFFAEYDHNKSKYSIRAVDVKTSQKQITVSEPLFFANAFVLQCISHNNKEYICAKNDHQIVIYDIECKKKHLLNGDHKEINLCGASYLNLNKLLLFSTDNSTNESTNINIDKTIDLIDKRIVELVIDSEYEKYLYEIEKGGSVSNLNIENNENETIKHTCIMQSEVILEGQNPPTKYFELKFGFNNDSKHSTLYMDELCINNAFVFGISKSKYVIFNGKGITLINQSLEVINKTDFYAYSIQPISFKISIVNGKEYLELQDEKYRSFYDIESNTKASIEKLDYGYIDIAFYKDIAFSKEKVDYITDLLSLPQSLIMYSYNGNNGYEMKKNIDKKEFPGFDTIFINDLVDHGAIVTAYYNEWKDCPIDVLKVLNGDEQYIKENIKILRKINLSNYERISVIKTYIYKFDEKNERILQEEELSKYFNANLYCIIPYGYKELEDGNRVITLKFMKKDEYRIIIVNKNEISFDFSLKNKNKFINNIVIHNMIFCVFEHEILIIDKTTNHKQIVSLNESIISVCKYNNDLFILYNDNKVARLSLFDNSIVKDDRMILLSKDTIITNVILDNVKVKNKPDNYIELFKCNC